MIHPVSWRLELWAILIGKIWIHNMYTFHIFIQLHSISLTQTLSCKDTLCHHFVSFYVTVNGSLTEYHNSDPQQNYIISTIFFPLSFFPLLLCIYMDIFVLSCYLIKYTGWFKEKFMNRSRGEILDYLFMDYFSLDIHIIVNLLICM